MRNRQVLIFMIFVILFAWPVYQLVDLYFTKKSEKDSNIMLYQVSLFQIELLNNLISDSMNANNTEQLNALKQFAYTADYTHQHLVLAYGETKLTNIHSFLEIMQYIIRLQLGGDRSLKPEEAAVFQEISKAFVEITQVYEGMLSEDGKIIASQNEKLIQLDEAVSGYLRKILLE
ncbi:hypothetical protein [Chengkuizengella axinellae]|uniref:S-adenosylmethionine decarboxylase n=1 Tax=Chengkuizengella axinellae TaxID=3064388 RepID=A0ABT9ITS8_9BACL|nr:hypothetical protein [Chengkuizengella sp. 2205SS18-9]MDP5272692.1 hypothetical protein [Chengkuizengella sp. 2205SS18-9]